MSNRMFQSVIRQMKDTVGRTVGVVDETGTVVACSDVSQLDSVKDGVQAERLANNRSFVRNRYTFKGFSNSKRNDFFAFVEGEDNIADRFAGLIAISLQNLLQYHDEKLDKLNFVKNVVMDNIMPGDIYARAREMHFAGDTPRVVLIIRVAQQKDISTYEVVQNLFPDKQKDFVFDANETDTVLVKELKKGIEAKDIEKLAASIVDTLNVEYYIKAVVGIGTPAPNIRDLASSFKEAQIALEVGKVFDTERSIVNYENLGIARLIYQLPTTLCEMFLKEVFKQGSIESLDQETLFTIQSFFENNLNVSETSRGLFVHRNTLVYRLEKIRKITGLDLRKFDDAIVFKVALMVKKYLRSATEQY